MRPAVDYTLYLVTDPGLAGGRALEEIVREAVAGGVTIVQVREKQGATRDFLARARRLKALLDPLGVPLVVNDRVDVALAAGAAGVHVGQSDLPCAETRRLVGEGMLVGVSVSSVEEAVAAERDGADYLGASPVFGTSTKLDLPPALGLEGLRAVCGAVRVPVVGIGGLNETNAAAVSAAGAAGVAVVSAIVGRPDPRAAAAALRRALSG